MKRNSKKKILKDTCSSCKAPSAPARQDDLSESLPDSAEVAEYLLERAGKAPILLNSDPNARFKALQEFGTHLGKCEAGYIIVERMTELYPNLSEEAARELVLKHYFEGGFVSDWNRGKYWDQRRSFAE